MTSIAAESAAIDAEFGSASSPSDTVQVPHDQVEGFVAKHMQSIEMQCGVELQVSDRASNQWLTACRASAGLDHATDGRRHNAHVARRGALR